VPTARHAKSGYADERQLIEGLRRGDEAAFAWLMDHHYDRLLAVARRYFHELEDARDAVQDALLAAFRAIERFEARSTVSTWLHRIVVNVCLMKVRSRSRKPEQSLRVETVEEPLAPRPAEAIQALEAGETEAQVRAVIHALPEPHRSVLRLRDLEERNTRETAGLLNVTPAAVKTRLHRARTLLRTELQGSALATTA
jgi:RNA polymerase sigma-70 factor (ECF subfamily)